MTLDATLLSRIQFAFTISFHILFPAFSIGMVSFLVVMEGLWLKTKNPKYLQICKFWTKVFALTFGMGVVSGIVMEFQFGTNWAGFAHEVGDVLGALFTYEVMTAFFIEAGFLGVMLFGWNRVGPKLHYLATCLVCLGTTVSAFWILAANSWMQTPAGFTRIGNRLLVNSWWHVIFNPSVIPRFFHMLIAAYVSAGFAIAAIAAFYLLKKRHVQFAKTCFSFVMGALLLLTTLQIVVGDTVGTEVHRHQPIKTAAMEGVWNTQKGAPFLVFAIPDQQQQKNFWAIKIPHMAAFINTHKWDGKLVGLKSVARQDQPDVPIVFFSFRIMVYIGFLMFGIVLLGLWLRLKKRLYDSRWFLRICVLSAPLGFIALWCGWMTAEVGRQPWVVYNILRTSDAASNIAMHNVIISFVLIFIVYFIIFGYFYFLYLTRLIRKGPHDVDIKAEDQPFPYLAGPAEDSV